MTSIKKQAKKNQSSYGLTGRTTQKQPRTLEGGFWHKLIYQHQMWLDGLYMASPFLARYGAEFNRPDLIDEAVKQFTLCHKHTYSPENRIISSCLGREQIPTLGKSARRYFTNFWGRSIGWWFMAMVDVLDYIPDNHPGRASLISWIQGWQKACPTIKETVYGIR